MRDRPVVIVISDLHLGGGAADRGDDHVFDNHQLQRFIDGLLASADGQAGRIELYINGDFLEFAQVRPDVYTLRSARAWCSEQESLIKLEAILQGHANVFDALRRFSGPGNVVTLAAGNHDVDLFWSGVQARLKAVAGELRFVLGDEWTARFGGLLQIAHGHQRDQANRFKNWSSPFLEHRGERRLEMCPGTLFMVKFVNWLEDRYPFADNIKPVGALRRILWRENKLGLLTVAWMLSRFALRHPGASMGKGAEQLSEEQLFRVIVDGIQDDAALAETVRGWYRRHFESGASDEAVDAALREPKRLEQLLMSVMAEEDPAVLQDAFNTVTVRPGTLGDTQNTLQIAAQGRVDDKQLFRELARERMDETGAKVVVLGHTHCPDEVRDGATCYFNPGSWTRYAELDKHAGLTLESLRDETRYPYALNFVRVEQRKDGGLEASMLNFEKSAGGV